MPVRSFALPGTTGVVGPLFQTSAVQGKKAENQFFKFLGLTITETAGTSKVTVTVTDSTGQTLAVSSAPAGQSPPPLWFGPEGVQAEGQLTVTYSGTGVPSGCIYVR